ncbi:hypothetical protein [Engelhardtia mirabilis]|uniref:Bacterial Ig-like domain (Group 1) n=1 Tax=Engelhardtia mirabilis TaxID=2528011 RepID=A0A518BGI1_9BACT|nr:Bacterial Ig-like domain (group 1) [Planctomycetes bacterium Pla133]QDV00402.1 Bacterial Ig-like domain (group 1) [Planctomycetes bacterium Pla86]
MRLAAMFVTLVLSLSVAACGSGEAESTDAALPALPGDRAPAAANAELAKIAEDGDASAVPSIAGASVQPAIAAVAEGADAGRAVVDTSSVFVTVVDATLGLPLAGVEVRAFDVADLDESDAEKVVDSKLRRKRLWRDLAPKLTGEDGTVHLPAARAELYVVAELDNREAWARTRGADLSLELDVPRPVPLRLMGLDGRVVAGLQLELETDPDRRVLFASPDRDLSLEPTDERGRTEVTQLQDYRRRVAERTLESSADPDSDDTRPEGLGLDLLLLKPLAPGLDGPPLEVRLSDFTPPALDVVLPPHGSLRIRLGGAGGRDAASGQDIEILSVGDRSSDATSFAADDRGVVSIPVVGLGRHFQVSSVHETVTVAGPIADGQVVAVELTGATAAVVIDGRVVDGDGAAVQGEFAVSFAAQVGGVWTEAAAKDSVRSDENGRVEIAQAWVAGLEAEARELRLRSASEIWKPESGVYGRAALPVDLSAGGYEKGRLDVGDIVVAGPASITAGLVVEESGTPIVGQDLDLVRLLEPSEAVDYWSTQTVGSSTTDASGHFSFTHLPRRAGAKYELRPAGRSGPLSEGSWAVRVGAQDNRIEVPDSGGIALRLEAVEGFELGSCYLTVSAGGRDVWSGMLGQPMTETVIRVPYEGEVSLGLMDIANRLIVANVQGVEVRRGATTRDPRLLPLRVGGGLEWMTVTVVDPLGAPIRGVNVTLLVPTGDSGGMTGVAAETDRDGRAELLWSPDAVSLFVNKAGYFRHEAADLQAQMQVTLRPGGALRIEVDGDLDESGGRFQAYCARASIESLGLRLERSGNAFEGALYGPGDYTISWSWQEQGVDAITLIEGESTIEMLDVPGQQTFVVPAPQPPSGN